MLFPLLAPTEMSSPSLKTGAYILIGVGALTMLMGFLGCLGAVNEIRCLLGLVRVFMPVLEPAFNMSPEKYLLHCRWGFGLLGMLLLLGQLRSSS